MAIDAGVPLFSDNEQPAPDFSGIYADDSASPATGIDTEKSPAEQLFEKVSSGDGEAALQAIKDPSAGGPAANAPDEARQTYEDLLVRLKPFGISSLAQLRSKTDVQLRQLSADVVKLETRNSQLSRYFFRKADGTFDYSKTPDGRPTGLDSSGKLKPAGSAGPAAGPTPTAPTPAPAQPIATAPTPAPKTTSSTTQTPPTRTTSTTTSQPRVTQPTPAPEPLPLVRSSGPRTSY